MVVITGIKAAIKLAPIIYRGSKIIYKAATKVPAFKRYMSRHPKAVRYGTIAATGGTLVYDLLSIDYDSLLGPIPKTYRKQQQARGNFYSTRSRFQYKTDYCPVPRRRFGRQKQFNRSFYR